MKFSPIIAVRSPIFPWNQLEFDNDIFVEALYIASPTLYFEFLKEKTDEAGFKNEKINLSLDRYFSRSKTRCTPFGIFASVTTASWGGKNGITLEPNDRISLRCRPDMLVIERIVELIKRDDNVRKTLNFYPNTSLYKIQKMWRFVKYANNIDRRKHQLISINSNKYIESIIDFSSDGKKIEEIIERLSKFGFGKDDSFTYINDLIEEQILVSEIDSLIIGKHPFETILNFFEKAFNDNSKSKELEHYLLCFKTIKQITSLIETLSGDNLKRYQEILKTWRKLMPELEEQNISQMDSFRPTIRATIDTKIQPKLLDVIGFLNSIVPKIQKSDIEDFKERFQKKYDDLAIPINQVFDIDVGLSYPSRDPLYDNELIDDMYFNRDDIANKKFSTYQLDLLNIAIDSLKNKLISVELDSSRFKSNLHGRDRLPKTFSVVCNILDANANQIQLKSIGGYSAINLVSRFAHGDSNIAQLINELKQSEQDAEPDAILCEVVYYPGGRAGNVLQRSSNYEYELSYLANGIKTKIDLNDLLLSLDGGRFVLWSKSLNRRVLPRISSAHNFSSNSLPIYKFLGDLQSQESDKSYLGIDWDFLLDYFDYLPRLTYKSFILSPSKWRLRTSKYLTKRSGQGSIEAFVDICREANLPSKFLIVEGDNELLIDTANKTSIYNFLKIFEKQKVITVHEYLQSEGFIIDDKNNSYNNECIFSIINSDRSKMPSRANYYSDVGQTYPFGSEWLYLKIYVGVKLQEEILSQYFKDYFQGLIQNGSIKCWFFVKYNDGEQHLRIRFQVRENHKSFSIVQNINETLKGFLNANIISKIQIDTYIREINRYGDKMNLSENLFYYDSDFSLNIFSELKRNKSVKRWHIAILSVDRLMDDFGMSFTEKYELVSFMAEGFFKEFKSGKTLKVQLDKKYRDLKDLLSKILGSEQDHFINVKKALDIRSSLNREAYSEYNGETRGVDFKQWASSIIHMNLNRLFLSKARKNELVIYRLLSDYYRTLSFKNQK